jgi:hypothetical protein
MSSATVPAATTVDRLFRAGKDLDMTGISFQKLAS